MRPHSHRPLGAVLAAFALASPACASRAGAPAAGSPPGAVGRSSEPPLRLAEASERLVLDAPVRVEGRVGAVQVEVRLRNEGTRAVTVIPDPWLAEVALRGPGGEVRCAPAGGRMGARPVDLAARADVPLRVDVSARCEIRAPGEYQLEIAFPAVDAPTPRAAVRLSVAARTWVNPGPR